ncbi:hypothetical protein AJ80_03568 [Polytolypa hystricis UAMH7299]|uniref:Uncharacterized protein n=1 Tax=Polytolypa hystricis (strain UAMH7299) TaxID=1447883 RepID=A0A2B7YHC4_POLH7|nr:hypothetical protein AJ80_03568 [Polytolypa hystricis UAMH7299]
MSVDVPLTLRGSDAATARPDAGSSVSRPEPTIRTDPQGRQEFAKEMAYHLSWEIWMNDHKQVAHDFLRDFQRELLLPPQKRGSKLCIIARKTARTLARKTPIRRNLTGKMSSRRKAPILLLSGLSAMERKIAIAVDVKKRPQGGHDAGNKKGHQTEQKGRYTHFI